MVPLALALAAFALRAARLHLVAFPMTDEGPMAEAGREMLRGRIPYASFPLFHMPLVPLGIGLGLKLLGSMYAVRLLYLAANCLAVVPLYYFLKRVHPSRLAATTAVLFYLAFGEMGKADFGFVAIRQTANLFFILFLFLSLKPLSSRNWLAETLLSILSLSTFLPTGLNLLAAGMASVLQEQNRAARSRRWLGYAAMGGIALLFLLLFFTTMRGSWQQAVLGQIARAPTDRLARMHMILGMPHDRLFYILSTASLASGSYFCTGLRPHMVAMLVIILGAIFIPSNFLFQYPVIAAPAFCFGIFAFVLQAEKLLLTLAPKLASRVLLLVCVVASIAQLWLASGVYRQVWLEEDGKEYLELVGRLAKVRGPLLTLQPIYAVDARLDLVPDLDELYLRAPVLRRTYSIADYLAAGKKASVILVERRARGQIPQDVIRTWAQTWSLEFQNGLGAILIPPPRPSSVAQPR